MPEDAPCGNYPCPHPFEHYLDIILFRRSGWLPERLCICVLDTGYVDLLILLYLEIDCNCSVGFNGNIGGILEYQVMNNGQA